MSPPPAVTSPEFDHPRPRSACSAAYTCSVRRRRLSWDLIASSLPRVDLREALYTTRAMRRVSDKPIPVEVQARILDAAIRAPSGGNSQTWRVMWVDEHEVMAKLAPIYKKSMDIVWSQFYKERVAAAAANPDDPESQQMMRIKH